MAKRQTSARAPAGSYAPAGRYAWDLWIVRDGGRWHLFHLQAPRALHPLAIHQHASVGHAVSDDLRSWREVGPALEAGPPGAWDDRCIWTGSVLRYEGRWAMLYTGRRRAEPLVQRVGLAWSDDLSSWRKDPRNPVLTAAAPWYQTARAGCYGVEDWRDPYLCLVDGEVAAVLTARVPLPAGASRVAATLCYAGELALAGGLGGLDRGLRPRGALCGLGCVGLATSRDLVAWTLEPPVYAPGRYGMLECPQLLEAGGRWYLLFSTRRGWYHARHARRVRGGGQSGLHAVWGPTPRGPWQPVNGDGVVLGSRTRSYATRVVASGAGHWAVSWITEAGADRRFCGRIAAPRPIRFLGDRVEVGAPRTR